MNFTRVARVGLVLIPLGLFVGCGGCASRAAPGAKTSAGAFPPYNVIRLYNDSPDEIYGIALDADGTETTLDKLPPEHSPTRDRGIRPETEVAEVRWQSADGARQQQTVQIAGKLPPSFRGVIVFKLKATGDVETEFVRYEDLK